MSKIKLIVNLLIFGALILLILLAWSDILEAFNKVTELMWWILILAIPLQFLVVVSVAHLYFSYFKSLAILGQLKLLELYKIATELQFINIALPSGGVAGFTYLSLRLQPAGINIAASTLAQVVRFATTFVSFLVFLGLGLLLLAITGKAGGLVILVGSSIFSLTLFGVAIFVFLVSDQQRIQGFISWLPKTINHLSALLPYKTRGKELINMTKVERVLKEFHLGYKELHRNFKALKMPFLWALAVNLFDLLTLYVIFLAFGVAINPGAIILAYAIANFAGLVVILPGGAGVYEALMVSILAIAGVEDRALTLSATLIYRIGKLVLLAPFGLWFYHQALRHGINKSALKRKGGWILGNSRRNGRSET
ncbi:MAG: lysylphosphatidylglycerol synthase transmembrane domain-containing protein [Candidatus Saccharibacteria bacterium]|nr:lysylphosphatidylglycerol synthase transmembrane domain-containing protein [Candidatus Saccharibacteria bacterium]